MQKKKSLGQHFLKSHSALDALVGALDPTGLDIVLEIGPGEGVLTEKVLPLVAKVIALEKDSRLIPVLQEKFAQEIKDGRFDLIEGDALDFDTSILEKYDLKRFDFKLVGNIPYYITGALFKKFLSGPVQPSTLVFLIQKEVAERIVRRKSAQGRSASGGKESILSLSIKAYGTPTYIKTVPAGAFSPPPQVDSAILAVNSISRKNFPDTEHEEKFFALIKKGFAQKRKFLLSNLGKKEYAHILKKVGVSEKARAEDVPLEDWLKLSAL